MPVAVDGVGFLLRKIVAVFCGGGGCSDDEVDSSDETIRSTWTLLHGNSGELADDSDVVSASEASNKAFLWL